MRDSHPEKIMLSIGRLERAVAHWMKDGWNDASRSFAIQHLTDILKECEACGLNVSAKNARNSLDIHFNGEPCYASKNLDGIAGALRMTIVWEMETLCYFDIPSDRVGYWTNEDPFDKTVTENFPHAADDIEEASKCLALSRWTASAFHSLRVQEAAINAMYLALTSAKLLPEKCERSWGKVLPKIKNELDSRAKSEKPEWKLWTPPLATAYTFLNTAKGLWRDDTMHVGEKKTDKEAVRIFDATRILMQHLSEWINEDGIFHK